MSALRRELDSLGPASMLLTCSAAVVSVLLGSLLYRLVESPFMAMRDQWFPSNFATVRPTSNARLMRPLESNNN